MKLLIDTDVMIDLWRGYAPAGEWLRSLPEAPAVSVITVLELLRGCRNRREQAAVEQLFQQMPVLYLDEPSCGLAVDDFRAFYLKQGLGILDALIAASAVSHGLVLCTFNEKHYQGLPDLRIMRPYERVSL